MTYLPVNWNRIEDDLDKTIWETFTTNFWLDTRIPLSNDIPSWNTMSQSEQEMVIKVFAGLTLLDTLQSEVGANSLIADAKNGHERAVYNNISFMEAVHAKSYSSIFSTLCSTKQIDDVFEWAANNKFLQRKAALVADHYNGSDPLMRKAASVALESFLFYSGFYLPFYYNSRAKLTNTADLIRLIVRDEVLHGYYIGYKFQQDFKKLGAFERLKVASEITKLFDALYENEVGYINEIYGNSGLVSDVKRFMNVNYNKALQNLGFDAKFSGTDIDVNPVIITSLSPVSDETHDFFSGAGSSYAIAVVEETTDEDWNF